MIKKNHKLIYNKKNDLIIHDKISLDNLGIMETVHTKIAAPLKLIYKFPPYVTSHKVGIAYISAILYFLGFSFSLLGVLHLKPSI